MHFSLKLWQTLDDVIHHVVHSINGGDLDSVCSEVHKLPGQLSLALQCVLSYEKTLSTSSPKKVETENSSQKSPNTLTQSVLGSGDSGSGDPDSQLEEQSTLGAQSNSHSDSASRNQTVTSAVELAAATCGRSLVVKDEAEMVRRNVCSPTDITFFSNRMDSTVTSPTDNMATSGDKSNLQSAGGKLNNDSCKTKASGDHSNQLHSNSNLSNSNHSTQAHCSSGYNSSICSILSKNASRMVTHEKNPVEKDEPKMNINLSESKIYCQDKLGNKLAGFYESVKLHSSPVGKTGAWTQQDCYMKGEFRDRKLSNQIEKQTGPAPSKLLNPFKWIVLDDGKIGNCLLCGILSNTMYI